MKTFMKISGVVLFLVTFSLFTASQAAEKKITASDAQSDDYFGYSVSISGDYAIVGAHQEDPGGLTNAGAAYIFKRSGTSWMQQSKIIGSDIDGWDSFGYSVAISDDYAIVGAIYQKDGMGVAYIFNRNGTSWTQQAKITAADADTLQNDYFGCSVAISGDYAIVGAYEDDASGTDAGAAYIFKRSGASWTQQAKLTASDAQAEDRFGNSVSISGDYAIVGAYGEDAGGSNAGAAYIFNRSGTSWTQQAKITASDAQESDFFSRGAVSISGDYAIVGAYYEDEKGHNAGAAYIFNRSGTSWTQQAKITASEPSAWDMFGRSVSISGDYAISGAYGEDGYEGAVYSFLRNGTSWSETSKTTASDGQISDMFGWSVSISGNYAISGAYMEDSGGSEAGAAYIYENVADLGVPVELSSFTVYAIANTVSLNWSTATETENLGFHIFRSMTEAGSYTQITQALIPGAGNSAEAHTYSHVDRNVEAGNTYYYKLADVDFNGNLEFHGPVSVTVDAKPSEFALAQNFPNPFNPKTNIRFSLKEAGEVTLRIYNLQGQLVQTLFSGHKEAGNYSVLWNGADQEGRLIASGIYIYKLEVNGFSDTKQLVFMK